MPKATKLGMVLTYYEGLQPVKSHDPLITGLARSRGKQKNIIPLPQCPWSPNLVGW